MGVYVHQNKPNFQLGEDLYGVSIDELRERVTALTQEISRIDAEIDKKTRERASADSIFGTRPTET